VVSEEEFMTPDLVEECGEIGENQWQIKVKLLYNDLEWYVRIVGVDMMPSLLGHPLLDSSSVEKCYRSFNLPPSALNPRATVSTILLPDTNVKLTLRRISEEIGLYH